MKQILHRINSLICTPKNSNHLRSQETGATKHILQDNPVAHLHHLYFIRLIYSLSNLFVGETMNNWTAPKHNFMQHTEVLGCFQFTLCIPLSKSKVKTKNINIYQAGFFVFDKFALQVDLAGDKSGGV